jgi:ABC-type multidrug transport system fused ATPase/permease subunit
MPIFLFSGMETFIFRFSSIFIWVPPFSLFSGIYEEVSNLNFNPFCHSTKNLNATFERGINCIIGENGSGKTTLLKLLCDLYSPEKGEILLDGKGISKVKKESLKKI